MLKRPDSRWLKDVYLSLRGRVTNGIGHTLSPRFRFLESELSTWSSWQSMPVGQRLDLWRNGFLSPSSVIYDFETHDPEEYLSDLQREFTARINAPFGAALDNKLLFHWLMRPFEETLPEVYGYIDGPRVHSVELTSDDANEDGVSLATATGDEAVLTRSSSRVVSTVDWFESSPHPEAGVVLKPNAGSGGKGVYLCERKNGSYRINGESYRDSEFERFIEGLDNYLITEFVEQADYSDAVFSGSSNTIRVLTMWDSDAEEAFVAAASHRIGTERSQPTDNWSSGGLSAAVDVETGRLSAGLQFPYDGSMTEYSNHPDTGARIAGREVTNWTEIRDTIVGMADDFSQIPYIGWDVIPTDDGFRIIEANNCSGVRLFQIHQPLLTDPRVRRFYERHDVL